MEHQIPFGRDQGVPPLAVLVIEEGPEDCIYPQQGQDGAAAGAVDAEQVVILFNFRQPPVLPAAAHIPSEEGLVLPQVVPQPDLFGIAYPVGVLPQQPAVVIDGDAVDRAVDGHLFLHIGGEFIPGKVTGPLVIGTEVAQVVHLPVDFAHHQLGGVQLGLVIRFVDV